MNTIVKKLAVLASIALAANAAKAADSYLYWMADSSGDDISFSYATVKVDGETDYLYLYDGATMLGDYRLGATTAPGTQTGAAYFGTFTASPDMSFIFELWSGDETVGRTTVAYSKLFGFSSIFTDTERTGATAYTVSGFVPVPEPTSGLLALFGLAALALRRRKRA